MDVHGTLNDGIRRFRVHDVKDGVNYLIPTGSKDRSSQDLMRVPIDHYLHESLCFTLLHCAAYLCHLTLGGQCSFSSLADLSVAQSSAAERRIRIERVCLNAIAHAPRVVVEEIGRRDLKIVVRSVRKRAHAVAIAQGPNAGDVCSQLVVNANVPMIVDTDSCFLDTKVICVGASAD